jgi:hypothetical protein
MPRNNSDGDGDAVTSFQRSGLRRRVALAVTKEESQEDKRTVDRKADRCGDCDKFVDKDAAQCNATDVGCGITIHVRKWLRMCTSFCASTKMRNKSVGTVEGVPNFASRCMPQSV